MKNARGWLTLVMWLEFCVASLLKCKLKLLMFLGGMDLRKSPISLQVRRYRRKILKLILAYFSMIHTTNGKVGLVM